MPLSATRKGLISVLVVALVIGSVWYFNHKSSPPPTFRVGYLPIYVDLPFFVALENGLFEKHGVVVEAIEFQSSPQLAQQIVAGRLDAAASIATSNALITESQHEGLFQIFMVDQETREAYLSSLVIGHDSEISDPVDLIDKTIGFFPGPTAATFGQLALEKLGVPRDSYTRISLPVENHIDALEAGNVDALVTYEPTATQAVMRNGAKKLVPGLVETHVIDPWQAGVWIVSTEAISSREADTVAFIRAIYEAIDQIRADSVFAKRALAPYTPIDADIAVNTPNIPFAKIGEVDIPTLQKHADILQSERVIPQNIQIQSLMLSPDLLR